MKKEITTQTPSSADTGRSMIEMLGTLAIMGVLSIGGIAGYDYALTKYKANETMDELNKRAVVYATQILQNELDADTVLNDGEFGEVTTLGYDVSAVASEYENEFEIVLSNYPSDVCRDILKNYTVPVEIIIGNTRYNRDSDNDSICGEETAPETVFVYAADLEGVSEETLPEEKCSWTGWLDSGKPSFDKTGGEFESLDYVCAEGVITDIQCRAANYPSVPIEELGQVVICDINQGLICKNQDQKPGGAIPMPYCLNYEIKVKCCSSSEGNSPDDNGACSPGVEFKSGSTCYPCDKAGHYKLLTDEEYSLCSACGRSVFQGGSFNYCVPACRSGQVYHMEKEQCVTPECRTNADCGLNSGKYCKLDFNIGGFESSCIQQPPYGTCENTSGTQKPVTGVGTYQISSSSNMNWWSAQNYCQAIGGRMATVADFRCGYDYVGNHKTGYCNTNTTISVNGTRSPNIVAFQTAFGKSVALWTSDLYDDACSAYLVNLGNGIVFSYSRYNYNYRDALCYVRD